MADTDTTRDFWLESRNKSAAYRDSLLVRAISSIVRIVRPSAPLMGFGTAESLMMPDLNKYRPNVNVEMLIDQGVRAFALRVCGPGQWVYGDWKYEVDPTFTAYHQRIRAYAAQKNVKVIIIGYGVHNAWANEEGNYIGIDPQLTFLKEATRNHLCDQYCWDDEVGKCWKNGKETTITSTNLVKSQSILMEQTLTEMERNVDGSYKIPLHYSANWFMKQYGANPMGYNDYAIWLDRAGKDPANRRFMTWRAWLPQAFSTAFATIREIFDKLLTPTGIQDNAYLRMASEPVADLWQFTFTGIGPWNGTTGIDLSVGYGLSKTLADYCRNANIPLTVTPPVDEGGGEEPPTGDYVTRAEFEAWKRDVYGEHVHATGKPIS